MILSKDDFMAIIQWIKKCLYTIDIDTYLQAFQIIYSLISKVIVWLKEQVQEVLIIM